MPLELYPPPGPLRVLCLGAHSDDIEIGCGGTILELLAERPVRMRWVVLSASGRRTREAEDSARRFASNATELAVSVHGFPDGLFPTVRAELKATLIQLRDASAPDLVLTHDEEDLHQDHSLLGVLSREVFRHTTILNYEVPKYDGGLRSPNLFVTLDPATVARKGDLLLEGFPSQASKAWFTRDTFSSLMRLRGVESGSSTGYAEGFHVRKLCVDLARPGRAEAEGGA